MANLQPASQHPQRVPHLLGRRRLVQHRHGRPGARTGREDLQGSWRCRGGLQPLTEPARIVGLPGVAAAQRRSGAGRGERRSGTGHPEERQVHGDRVAVLQAQSQLHLAQVGAPAHLPMQEARRQQGRRLLVLVLRCHSLPHLHQPPHRTAFLLGFDRLQVILLERISELLRGHLLERLPLRGCLGQVDVRRPHAEPLLRQVRQLQQLAGVLACTREAEIAGSLFRGFQGFRRRFVHRLQEGGLEAKGERWPCGGTSRSHKVCCITRFDDNAAILRLREELPPAPQPRRG
mmetsp:Transcript_26066/g.77882  ORF Transcript_26066/g.77882 Transcript_26066/m.77882 type:complete len:290 (-) Transcript_26066:19-888(-)